MKDKTNNSGTLETTLPVISATLASRINELRQDRRDGKLQVHGLEPIFVDTTPLAHGKLIGVLIGGFGPDVKAPPVYRRLWSNSDLVGGVYMHPRLPVWYHRAEFVEKFAELKVTHFLTEVLGSEFNPSNPHFVLWAIMQIYG